MRVSVRFLSYLSDRVGAEQIELDLPAPARVADLTQRLQEMYPESAPLLAHAAYLIDQKHAAPETALSEGAQVLALMLLSGG